MKASRVETIISAIVITAAIGIGIPVNADQNTSNRAEQFVPKHQELVAISNLPGATAPKLDFIDYTAAQALTTPTTMDSIFTISTRDQIGCFVSSTSIDGIVTCGQLDNN
jgi:hypothetical protein